MNGFVNRTVGRVLVFIFCWVGVAFHGYAKEAVSAASLDPSVQSYFEYRDNHKRFKALKKQILSDLTETQELVRKIEGDLNNKGSNSFAKSKVSRSLLESKLLELSTSKKNIANYLAESKGKSKNSLKSVENKLDSISVKVRALKKAGNNSEKKSAILALKNEFKKFENIKLRKEEILRPGNSPGGLTLDPLPKPIKEDDNSLSNGDLEVIMEKSSFRLVDSDLPSYSDLMGEDQNMTLSFLKGAVDFVVPDAQASEYMKPSIDTGILNCYASATDYNNNIDADLDLTSSEIELDPSLDEKAYNELSELAANLEYSPVKILEYVTNNIEHEHYQGSVKGALGALQSGGANDLDHASLVVALLRASSIPSRYVRGRIYIQDKEEHLNWWNTKDLKGAQGAVLATTNPTSTIQYNIDGKDAFSIEHVWVQACVPYGDYRGGEQASESHRWVPIDASFKQYQRIDGVEIDVEFDYAKFLSERTKKLPVEVYQEQVLDYIRGIDSNLTLDDVGTRWVKEAVKFEFLPDSLPYVVRQHINWNSTIDSPTTAVLPENWKAKVHIYFANEGVFEIPSTDFAQHRITLSFAGVTDEDSSKYLEFLDGDTELECSSSNLQLKPIFKKDGDGTVYPISGFSSYSLCDGNEYRNLTLGMSVKVNGRIVSATKAGSDRISFGNITPLNYYALNAYMDNGSERYLTYRRERLFSNLAKYSKPSENLDETVGEFLNLVLTNYMYKMTKSNLTIGQLFGSTGRSGHHIGLTSTRADVEYLLDLPYAMHSNNFVVDVPGGISSSVNVEGGTLDAVGMRLGGYNSSHLESHVWQEFAMKDAVSTISGLQIASENDNEVKSFTNKTALAAFINVCTSSPSTGSWPRNKSLSSMVAAFRGAGFHHGFDDTLKSWFLNANSYFTSYSSTSSIDNALEVDFFNCYPQGSANTIINMSFISGYVGKVTISKYPVSYNGWLGPVYVVENIKPDNGGASFGFPISSFSGGYTVPTINPSIFSSSSSTSNYSTGFSIPSSISTTTPDFNTNAVSSVNSGVGSGVSSYGTTAFDPVNMVTGNMYHNETDISQKTRGMPLLFKRTYNSRAPENGPLGWGWTHSFNQSLEFKDTDESGKVDTIIWTNGTGSKKYITLKDSVTNVNGYLNITDDKVSVPDGFYFSLNRSYFGGTVPEIKITEKNGIIYYFQAVKGSTDDVAKLTGITDRNGNTLDLSYVSNRLDSVTDEDNRTLSFEYYPSKDLIHTVTMDWANITHEYIYDENDNLFAYRNPQDRDKNVNSRLYEYYNESDGQNLDHRMKSFAYANGHKMTFEYYVNGKAYRHYNAEGETVTFSYNDFRREATTIDEQGRVQSYIFNKDGLPQEITNALGGKETYFYENPNDPMLRTRVIDAMGYETSYSYDGNGNLVETVMPSGDTVTYYNYTSNGQPQKIKNAAGDYSIRLYNFQGNLTDSISLKRGYGATINPMLFSPTSNSTKILSWSRRTYDDNGKLETVRRVKDFSDSSSGPYTTYDYTDNVNGTEGIVPTQVTYSGDRNGDGIISATEGLGSYTSEYDDQGRLVSGFNSAFYPVEYQYDKAGHLIEATAPYGGKKHFSYDESGLVTSKKLIAKESGKVIIADSSISEYDNVNRLTKLVDSSGAESTFEYDDSGNMTKSTSPDGYSVFFKYDANNRVYLAYDAEGNTVERKLDLIGRLKQHIDPNGNITEYTYYGPEENGRLKRTTDAEGRWTEFSYYASGLISKIVDNAGRETLSLYDALGRVIRVVKPIYTDLFLGDIRPVTTYRYNSLGHQTHVYAGYTNSAANIVSDNAQLQEQYTFDDFGRLLKKTDAMSNEWQITKYDTHGNVTLSKDALGRSTSSIYGEGGLLTQSYSSGAATGAEKVRYSYNALGQPKDIWANKVHYSYKYDSAHRLKTVADSRGNHTVDYDYSIGGMLNSITDGHGNETAYLYDPVGRLTGVRAPDNQLVSYVYDAAGRLQQKVFPNDLITAYEYFKDNKVKSIVTKNNAGSEILSHQYTYNTVGDAKTAVHSILGDTTAYQYGYDGNGRLTSVNDTINNTSIDEIDYDQFGNRNKRVVNGQTQVYVHNALHQIEEIHENTKTGPLIASFEYDLNGNMTNKTYEGVETVIGYDSFDRVATVTQAGLPTEKYGYDHGVRRVQKTVGSDVTQYHYSGPDIIAEYSATNLNTPKAIFAHGASMDDPIWRSAANDASYYHADSLGSVVAMSNSTGAITATNQYDSWGNVTSSTGTTPQYGFTGREPNANGLMYYRSRYYDPQIARFTQPDPKGFIDGVNRYAYVMNSPVNYVDPWGTTASTPTVVSNSAGYMDAAVGIGGGLAEAFVPFGGAVSAALDGNYSDAAIEVGLEVVGMAAGLVSGGLGYVAIKTAMVARKADKLMDSVDAAANVLRRTCCFVAGTLVLTEDGYRPIDELVVGDKVWSKDVETGEKDWKAVTRLFEKYREIYELRVVDESGESNLIETTDDHPFYVVGNGFVDVIDLKVGQRIETDKFGWVEVESVKSADREDVTYNLEVEDFHTYYATKLNLLVHNCDLLMKSGGLGKSTSGSFNSVKKTISDIANSGDEAAMKCAACKLAESLKTRRTDQKGQRIKNDQSFLDHKNRIKMEQDGLDKINRNLK